MPDQIGQEISLPLPLALTLTALAADAEQRQCRQAHAATALSSGERGRGGHPAKQHALLERSGSDLPARHITRLVTAPHLVSDNTNTDQRAYSGSGQGILG
ncbi:hypothetical protein [uncultured Pseudodesulfovibrio sp.]|uniref:hypothetical protein n=1 Tax=uncultured Pseudodesulfovibrio sp. TaxID=2035858 RepID=UPI0029C8AA89|nr:hypothetical protein [uncultured Pseudodesulfovibrio sp.]